MSRSLTQIFEVIVISPPGEKLLMNPADRDGEESASDK
jgi:hypothetical protein